VSLSAQARAWTFDLARRGLQQSDQAIQQVPFFPWMKTITRQGTGRAASFCPMTKDTSESSWSS